MARKFVLLMYKLTPTEDQFIGDKLDLSTMGISIVCELTDFKSG